MQLIQPLIFSSISLELKGGIEGLFSNIQQQKCGMRDFKLLCTLIDRFLIKQFLKTTLLFAHNSRYNCSSLQFRNSADCNLNLLNMAIAKYCLVHTELYAYWLHREFLHIVKTAQIKCNIIHLNVRNIGSTKITLHETTTIGDYTSLKIVVF